MDRSTETIDPASRPPAATLRNCLLIGIGNDGRADDGLGWAFVDTVEQDGRFPGTVTRRYQLQIEDAELICHWRHVVFVDACRQELPAGFCWQVCRTGGSFEFTSHRLSPESVLSLCRQLYATCPQAHLLLIQGHAWDIQTGISEPATRNLERAWQDFQRYL
jgi:hydrogenase maturation protease